MLTIDLSGKKGVVLGVANHRSIAWAIAQALDEAGLQLALGYQNDRLKENLDKLAPLLKQPPLMVHCDVTEEETVRQAFKTIGDAFGTVSVLVHSLAFANKDDLSGEFLRTEWEGYRLALQVSAYSLLPIVRCAAPLMEANGGSIITMTFQASTRVFPGYNVMGTAKAALEHEMRQLAYELGPKNIRVNAISAGPLDTLAARGIHGFVDMKRVHAERAPLQRNITHREVGTTALFLASELSSGVTGEIIHVDAGYNITGL
ncbi:MAG: enoyl-ACP reductase [Dehalococcoidia bacterium]|nr:enoyl-ACP reductase [Dehalococcoidia bacterium]